MSNTSLAIRPFDFQSNIVRTVADTKGNPWFVATDVAVILGYRDAANMVRMLDEDEKDTHNLSTPGGDQMLLVISESGMYACVLKSRRPEAKAFRKWVTADVLPSIRKTGQYSAKDIKSKKALPGGLTLDQQDSIKEIVRLRVESLPKDKQAKGAITIWSALRSKFDVPTYKAIPPDLVTEAVSVAARVPLDGEMAITASFPEVMKNYRWMVYRDHDQRHHVIPVENDAFVATVSQLIDSIRSPHGMWMTDMELIEIIEAASSRLRARKFPAPN